MYERIGAGPREFALHNKQRRGVRMKENARVLDATAGNRTMWDTKDTPLIVWIDIEKDLTVQPDILMDCTNTEFEGGRFHTIFFDPPHSYGRTKNTGAHQTPSQELQREKWGRAGAYYGFDKYLTKPALLAFINKSQKEFQRILSDDGVLWFKWAEIHATLDSILPLFNDWTVMMKHEVAYRGRVKTRTWWVTFMKKFAV